MTQAERNQAEAQQAQAQAQQAQADARNAKVAADRAAMEAEMARRQAAASQQALRMQIEQQRRAAAIRRGVGEYSIAEGGQCGSCKLCSLEHRCPCAWIGRPAVHLLHSTVM